MMRIAVTLLGPASAAAVALFMAAAASPVGPGHELGPAGAGSLVLPAAEWLVMPADSPIPQRRGGRLRHKEVDFSISCNECHRTETPEEYADWEASLHGTANVGCFVCHGDGEVEFHSRPSDESCLSCHSERMVDAGRLPEGGCFACHTGHRLTFHTH